MKVSNYDVQPNNTLRSRKLALDPQTAMRALIHKGTQEAILVTENSVKYHPQTIELETWKELLALADPEEEIPKKVSSWAWLTGDNPFLVITSAGNPFPLKDTPEEPLDYEEARAIYTEAKQAALHSRGLAAAIHERMGMYLQVVMAGICVLGAIVTVLVLLPRALEGF